MNGGRVRDHDVHQEPNLARGGSGGGRVCPHPAGSGSAPVRGPRVRTGVEPVSGVPRRGPGGRSVRRGAGHGVQRLPDPTVDRQCSRALQAEHQRRRQDRWRQPSGGVHRRRPRPGRAGLVGATAQHQHPVLERRDRYPDDQGGVPMRVRRFSLARLRDEEQGAVLAMVAISLIVLIGMAVLTFDLGRGVALKRNMVNAADAGALAAARECGLANGEASAMAAASELVADNNDAATVTGMEINPDPAVCSGAGNPDPDGHNTVTVTVNMPQEYFFAQIFGFDGGTVAATATAEWTLELSGPAPLKVEALKVDECLRGGTESSCYVGYEDVGAQWGWLNFPEGWPAQGEPNPPAARPSKGGADDFKH